MYYIGIDPSMSTGIVVLDENLNVVSEEVIEKHPNENGKCDINKRIKCINELVFCILGSFNYDKKHKIAVESFSHNSKGKFVDFQHGLGYMLRDKLLTLEYDYLNITPTQLKKFATGKGNSSKDIVMREVYKKWGYSNDNNNIVDAYVLARIAAEYEK